MATPTSGAAASKQNGTAKSGGKRKKVASQAGVARYHKPIGTEIGGPRDANHAAIQQDQGARNNYTGLVSGDQAAQRKQLDGMSTDDLNKLADIAFSFRSSDPKVVALRIQARNAQARRGIHVKVGQTQTYPKGAPAKAAPSVNYNNRGATKALARQVGAHTARLIELAAQDQKDAGTSKFGNFPIKDISDLRNAISAVGRAKPEQRPAIARHIITMAGQLKASHLISDAIRNYAKGNTAPVQASRSGSAVELAGRWKHGFIPLDAEAMASKMKGGKGKPWWEGGHGHSGGSAKKALHGSPKSGSPSGSPKRTNVVKSGSADSTTKGATVNDTYTRGHAGAKDGFDRGHRVSYTLNGKKHTGTITRIEKGSGATVRQNRGGGAHDLVDRKNLTHLDSGANPPAKEKATGLNIATGKTETRAVVRDSKGKIIGTNKTGAAKSAQTRRVNKSLGAFAPGNRPNAAAGPAKADANAVENGKRYIQMHGTAGARAKVTQLEARGHLTGPERVQLAGLKKALGG